MLIKKISTAIATGAVLLNALAPMTFAATTDVVAGNGAGSQNTINTSTSHDTTVSQNNTANISNVVISNATTGGNNASANTGGNTTVTSGNANSTVNIANSANKNTASVSNCGCADGGNTVGIIDNGAGSRSLVNAANSHETEVSQSNSASISNLVTSNAETGGNNASANTGGNTTVKSGNAVSNVAVANAANVNAAQIGSGAGSAGSASGDTVLISGNGAGSQNTANVSGEKEMSLDQTNSAEIVNSVFSDAGTGGNNASANTGGNVNVTSGFAASKIAIVNEPNFNVASLNDCGCTTTGDLFKIAGNGAGSNSAINADTSKELNVTTSNDVSLDNFAIPTAETGGNDASDNTGAVNHLTDPSVTSGDAMTQVTVTNHGNSNTVGNGALTLPTMGGVNFSSDFSSVWGAWMTFMSSFNG